MKRVEDYADTIFTHSITNQKDVILKEHFITKVTSYPKPEYYGLLQIVLNYTDGCHIDKTLTSAKPLHKVLKTIAQEGDLTDEQSKEVTRQLKLYVGAIAEKPKEIVELAKDIVKKEHEEFKMKQTLPQAYKSLAVPDIESLKVQLTTVFRNLKSDQGSKTEEQMLAELKSELTKIANANSAGIMLSLVGLEDWQTQPREFLNMSTLEQDKMMQQGIYTKFISQMQQAYTEAYNSYEQQRDINSARGFLIAKGFSVGYNQDTIVPTEKEMGTLLKRWGNRAESAVNTILGIEDLTTKALDAKASEKAKREVKDLRASLKLIRLSKDTSKAAKAEAIKIAPTLGTRLAFRKADISAPSPKVSPPVDLKPKIRAPATPSVAEPPSIEPPLKAPELTTRQAPSIPSDLILEQLGVSMDDIVQKMSGSEENTFVIFSGVLMGTFSPIKKSPEDEGEKLRMLQEVKLHSEDLQVLYNAGISEVGTSISPSDFLRLPAHEQDEVLKAGILKEYVKMSAANKHDESSGAGVSMFNNPAAAEDKSPKSTISLPRDSRDNDLSV